MQEGTFTLGMRNYIYGKNAQGKTNLLEAIYFLLTGRSFRLKNLSNLINDNAEYLLVSGKLEEEEVLEQFLTQTGHVCKINKIPKRLSDFWQKNQVICFEPSDVELIGGEPSERRRLLDIFLSSVSADYLGNLREYGAALEQRNNLLKQRHFLIDELLVWDEKLIEPGNKIINNRHDVILGLAKYLKEIGESLGFNSLKIQLSQKEYDFGQILAARLEIDRKVGHTTVGPHREDWLLLNDGLSLSGRSSRGEQRLAVLALKLAMAEYLKASGKTPLVVLDDIFSELDDIKKEKVLNLLEGLQICISSLLEDDNGWSDRKFEIIDGEINGI